MLNQAQVSSSNRLWWLDIKISNSNSSSKL